MLPPGRSGCLLRTKTASSVTLNASPHPVTFGQPLTLTATVTPGATGKVTFYDGTTVLGIGTLSGTQAALATTLLSFGTRSLWAHYSGDTAYAPGNSAAIPETVLVGTSLGFRHPTTDASGGYADSVAVGDLNGDGKADLAVANSSTGNVSVLLGNGDGTFRTAVNYATGSYPYVRRRACSQATV